MNYNNKTYKVKNMKKEPIFIDLDEPGVLVNFSNRSRQPNENIFKELPSTKEILQQQEKTTNMKWLFVNHSNENTKKLIEFVGKNSIKVMFSLSSNPDPVRQLTLNGEQLTEPVSRTQLQAILKEKSPQKLNNTELEEVLNIVYAPILSKTNFLDNIKNSKMDLFIDDNPKHLTPWKK